MLVYKQMAFTHNIGKLIEQAYKLGYGLTFGDASRMDNQGHKPNSFHYRRLAVDLNLFVNDQYQPSYCPEWQELGDYWKSLDPNCTWGGDFKNKDYNHFSYGEK